MRARCQGRSDDSEVTRRDEPLAGHRIPATAVLFRLLARLAAVAGVDDHLHMVRGGMPASKRLAAMLGRGAPHRAVGPLGAEGVCERPFETLARPVRLTPA